MVHSNHSTKLFESVRVSMLAFNRQVRDPRVWKEAKSLVQRGALVDVYMLRGGEQPFSERVEDGMTVWRFSSSSPASRNRPVAALRASWSLACLLRTKHYHVYHCHDGDTLAWGLFLSRRDRAPLVYDAHEYFPDNIP